MTLLKSKDKLEKDFRNYFEVQNEDHLCIKQIRERAVKYCSVEFFKRRKDRTKYLLSLKDVTAL